MLKSLLLAAFVLMLAALCAWAVVHFGRKSGQQERKLRKLRVGLLVGGLAGALFAFWTDWDQRRTTLFEIVLAPAAARHELRFEVVHAGVEHVLRLAPKTGFGAQARREVAIVVHLASGAIPLIDERRVFEVRVEGGGRAAAGLHRTWEAHAWPFTPATVGEHRLTVVLEGEVPQLLVRVEDAELRDGRRAPGY